MELFGSVRKKEILKTQKNETISRPWIIFYKKISYVVFLQNIRKKTSKLVMQFRLTALIGTEEIMN